VESGLWASLWWAAGRTCSGLQKLLHTCGTFSINGMNARLNKSVLALRSFCVHFLASDKFNLRSPDSFAGSASSPNLDLKHVNLTLINIKEPHQLAIIATLSQSTFIFQIFMAVATRIIKKSCRYRLVDDPSQRPNDNPDIWILRIRIFRVSLAFMESLRTIPVGCAGLLLTASPESQTSK
jgi:hypothetical protein